MCGISGIVSKESNHRLEEDIKVMNDILHHRGPDENAITNLGRAIFGHTRLSIIDINGGIQPMQDQQACITFNGEIYNHKEIRKKIDYPYKTRSDTEVILALYKKYKLNMFDKIEGMFAFGLWDKFSEQLILARDAFGEKPLFYCFGENSELIFSSEIKAILALDLITPVISKKSLTTKISDFRFNLLYKLSAINVKSTCLFNASKSKISATFFCT